ncbi:MAG: glycosyltransferase [Candidatus Berkelbacteria bacterium]|nr:MAG: glycosyltransferase [Candidatus Berkelbacteria bacterium]QQG51675.1 MAG: glycosyltransferase [Candidatus Berkelbacteria bacterium]
MGQRAILHAPTDVGGQAWAISKGMKELGQNSRTMVLERNYFNYGADIDLELKDLGNFQRIVRRWHFFLRALRRCDVFYFYFAQSLLPYSLDLPLLRLFGKKVIFIFQGCDIRLQKMSYPTKGKKTIVVDHAATCPVCAKIPDWKKLWRLRYLELFAHQTYCVNPDLLFVAKAAKFLPYAHILPKATVTKKPGKVLTLLHAPTERSVKGTSFIIAAVSQLQRQGHLIKLKLIEGKPHETVLHEISRADLIIDQVKIGWYGSLAVEALSLGKPVMCFLEPILIKKSGLKDCPIINVTAETLAEQIEQVASDPSQLAKLGVRSAAFARRYHDHQAVARLLLREL